MLTTTNGVNWSDALPVVVFPGNTPRMDSALAVDPRPIGPNAGSLYIAGIYNNTFGLQGVWLRYSRDGGRTWSTDVRVSDIGNEFSSGPLITVASDGTVYVAFEEVDNGNIANPPKLFLDRSTDGGATFGTDRLITGAPVVPIGAPDEKGRESLLVSNASCGGIHVDHHPSIAVSPTDTSTLYITWNDGRWERPFDTCAPDGTHADIAFSSTSDGGQTWSAPVRVNDDVLANGVDQFQPTMAVRADGLLGITWYDRRYSLNPYYYDLAYSQSGDGGATWSSKQPDQ